MIDFDAELAATHNPRRIAWLTAFRQTGDFEYARQASRGVECTHEGERGPFCAECGEKLRNRYVFEWIRDQLWRRGLYPRGLNWWKWGGI